MLTIDHLAGIPLFQGLSDHELGKLAEIVKKLEFNKGAFIFVEGDKALGFYLVISGLIKVYKLSFEGKEQILHILGPGESFAEVAVFTGMNYPANTMALEKSHLFFFPAADFATLIADNSSLAMNMLASLSLRLKQFTRMIEDLSLKEVPGRLAAYLLLLSSKTNGHHTVTLEISKTQLASLLGTIPETLSRILTRMNKQQYILGKGANINLLDRQGLEDLASGEKRL